MKAKSKYKAPKVKVSVSYDDIKQKLSDLYDNEILSTDKFNTLVNYVFAQVKSLIAKGLSQKSQQVMSIKCLDLWFYYVPKNNDTTSITISFFDTIQPKLGCPDLYEAGVEYGYGDSYSYVIKKTSENPYYISWDAKAARYDDAISLFDENQDLKRRIAWLEKQVILK